MIRLIVFCCLVVVALSADNESCNYKGNLYKKGDRFMDDCNRCFCGRNGMVGCTKMMCIPRHGGRATPMEAEKDSCNYKGKTYQKGDSFMDDCNHCFCGGNDVVGCTKMLCLPHERPMPLEENSEDCMFNGKIYKKGESFKKECNTCFCGGKGVIGCTLMMCKPKHRDANPYKITTCEHKGKTYNYGEHFMDDCNKCFCGVNGHAGCTQMMCIHPEDLPYADSETCTRDGKVYKKGDNFSLDGCNRCFCGGNNVIGCTKRLCPPKGCYHDGKFFKVGESYKNDCNRCICTKRGGACTKMACPH